MSLLVKICGLKTADTLAAALEAGADMVGFVFFPPSPRNLGFDAAKLLAAQVRGRARKVALTVDASDALLDDVVAALQPDMLQFHGHETPERLKELKQRFGLPVMKALPVAERSDLAAIQRYEDVAEHLLFDARPPKDATRPGGLGSRFDWTLLRGVATRAPYLLSGGLDAGNVAEALAVTQAPGVDVSSGVERSPGEKDSGKIFDFIHAARSAANLQQKAVNA